MCSGGPTSHGPFAGYCFDKAVNNTVLSPVAPPGTVHCQDQCHMSIPQTYHTLFGVLFLSYLYLILQVARFQYDSSHFSALHAKELEHQKGHHHGPADAL